MAKPKVVELVKKELAPFLAEAGYQLYHLEYVKEGRDRYLRVFIEKAPATAGGQPENPGTDDCEKVSRYLGARLDELDPIEDNYYLEVSSPGMDRPLITEEHYRRYQGEMVDVRLYEAVDGKKQWLGHLLRATADLIEIRAEGTEQPLLLKRGKVAGVRLAVRF